MKRNDLCAAVRKQLKRLPAPYDSHYGVVPLPPPESGVSLGNIYRELREANQSLAKVSALANELGYPWLMSRILPRREAVSSSRLEGTNSTLDELLSVEETESSCDSPDTRQVRSYAISLEKWLPSFKEDGYSLFTKEVVCELHRAVMREDVFGRTDGGELRHQVVWIGGKGHIAYSTYNPTPPEEIEICLEQSLNYLRSDGIHGMAQGLIVRMAIGHAHFEAVHPFRDGNGRVGRLLLPLMMASEGEVPLYLSPYIEEYREDYYSALRQAQQKLNWEEIILFFARAITGTVQEVLVTKDALEKLGLLWLKRRAFRRNSAALRALELLPYYPVITIKRLAQLLEITIPASTQAIEQLVMSGILSERTGYKRNRIFVSKEVLELYNRPFGRDPELPGS